jgi:7-carboxy-7-deazaguanine synthase
MNIQQIEKAITANGILDVHSIFHTIQGEGPFCGTPAIFIRLAGCNLQCPACDTDYTSTRTQMTVGDILAKCVSIAKEGLIVITGGEPFRQQIGQIVGILISYGFYVQIETNGTLPPSQQIMWSKRYWERKGAYIVCSPKSGRLNSILEKEACCFKYVITHNSVHEDGLPLKVLDHSCHPFVARAVLRGRPVYIQPADNKNENDNILNNNAAIASSMKNGYILQLQVHKFLDLE